MRSTASLEVLVRAISGCDDCEPCGEILCPSCARQYRLWLVPELLHFFPVGRPAFVATILLVVVPGPSLHKIDLKTIHDRVRKRLLRAGFTAAIGGTEADFKVHEDRWVVHVHLLIVGDIDEAKPRLKKAFPDIGLGRPVFCRRLENPVAQISYLQKFHTFHRPGSPGFSGRGRAYPLKPQQVVQLAKWTERRRFEDFLFLLGLRRRGSRFVAERGFETALRRFGREKPAWRRGDVATRQKDGPTKRASAPHRDRTSVTHNPTHPTHFLDSRLPSSILRPQIAKTSLVSNCEKVRRIRPHGVATPTSNDVTRRQKTLRARGTRRPPRDGSK